MNIHPLDNPTQKEIRRESITSYCVVNVGIHQLFKLSERRAGTPRRGEGEEKEKDNKIQPAKSPYACSDAGWVAQTIVTVRRVTIPSTAMSIHPVQSRKNTDMSSESSNPSESRVGE